MSDATEPRTEAGRAYHTMMHGTIHDHIPNPDCAVLDAILAIEAEAARGAAPLDANDIERVNRELRHLAADRPEPRTEAGRRLARHIMSATGNHAEADILAIEAEARSTPAEAHPLLVKYGLEGMAGDPIEVLHRHLTNNHAATVGGYKLALERAKERLAARSTPAEAAQGAASLDSDVAKSVDYAVHLMENMLRTAAPYHAPFIEKHIANVRALSEGAAPRAEGLREAIIETLHRYECDDEPAGHDWREHLPEDEPDFHPNRIDALVDLLVAAPLPATKPKCLRCGAAWVHRDDYAGLGTPHPYEPSEGAAPLDANDIERVPEPEATELRKSIIGTLILGGLRTSQAEAKLDKLIELQGRK